MDERIEKIAKEGTEFVAEYVENVVTSSAKLVDNLIGHVTALTRTLVADGSQVVTNACDAFLAKNK